MGKLPSTSAPGAAVLAALAVLCAAGCGDGPVDVEFEVIEEVEFAASLGIDLSQMVKLGAGVYRQDLVAGTGDTLVFGKTVGAEYQGWLKDGTLFGSGPLSFPMGLDRVVRGLEDGLVGMLEGGTRRIIVPPERGYGGAGSDGVPPGAIMVFEVDLIDVF